MRIPILMTLILALPIVAAANIPDLSNCHAEMPDGPLPRYLMVTPSGMGPALSEGRIDGGDYFSAVITLTLANEDGDPIALYPAEDVWLMDECGAMAYCALAIPDGPTDENGQTDFTGPYAAGGHMPADCLIEVLLGGSPLWEPGLELRFNSPDINGDLAVNLSDITVFTQALGEYDWAADYNFDGVINLSDIARMTQSIGFGCP